LEKIIHIYQEIKDDFDDYLVKFDFRKDKKPSLNIEFLKKIYEMAALKEDEWMKKDIQSEVDKFLNGYVDERQKEFESKLSEYDKIKNRYTHMHIASPHHPLFEEYQKEIRSLDYNRDYDVWRNDYYDNFLGVKSEEDSKMIDLCIENYLESLYFTLNYYLVGCPSWSWHYKFRVAPLLNDVFKYLDKNKDIEKFNNFKLDSPMTPFQQLLFILPPQNSHILPEVLRPIMNDDSIGVTQYYPEEIRIDAAFGGKTMYSEAILPEIDDNKLRNIIEKYEKKLTGNEKNRNIIREKSFGN